VVARYVIEGTEDEIADDKSVKPTDTPVDEPYGDTPPTTISFGGKTYTLVRTRTNEGDAPKPVLTTGVSTFSLYSYVMVCSPSLTTPFSGASPSFVRVRTSS
ncbi:hypothetical protein HO927_11765, partial [Streptococcus suis]|nr:hypothetical protein [Streptococcus suis]